MLGHFPVSAQTNPKLQAEKRKLMAGDGRTHKNNNNNDNGKTKKRKYLPHGKPVRKGAYPLRPGVQGFFITCDGGRERQATNEAVSLLDTFYEELMDGKNSGGTCRSIPSKPLNKKIKFQDPDSSSDEAECPPGTEDPVADKPEKECKDPETAKPEEESKGAECPPGNEDPLVDKPEKECKDPEADKHEEESKDTEDDKHQEVSKDSESVKYEEESEGKPGKKQRIAALAKDQTAKDKPIDELIEDELREMGDRNKRHFVGLESGCNGCIFIQMNRSPGDPGPARIVQHMMSSAASTRKHMSRFILRVVPAEVTCYASEEEISRAIKPLIEQYFPTEASNPQKFAVLYEARANTGVERMKIINAVAKSVPEPHKVDLSNPDKSIIVQVAKTICMVGVVERYKELSKFNLRQLTTPQQ